MTEQSSAQIRKSVQTITKNIQAVALQASVLSSWKFTKRLDYPTVEPLAEALQSLMEICPKAMRQVAKRKETSIRQSFSKVRSDAIDEANSTKVGTKTRGRKNA